MHQLAVQEHIHQISVFPVNDWSSRARAGHLENISLERRGPFVGWWREGGGRKTGREARLFSPAKISKTKLNRSYFSETVQPNDTRIEYVGVLESSKPCLRCLLLENCYYKKGHFNLSQMILQQDCFSHI